MKLINSLSWPPSVTHLYRRLRYSTYRQGIIPRHADTSKIVSYSVVKSSIPPIGLLTAGLCVWVCFCTILCTVVFLATFFGKRVFINITYSKYLEFRRGKCRIVILLLDYASDKLLIFIYLYKWDNYHLILIICFFRYKYNNRISRENIIGT